MNFKTKDQIILFIRDNGSSFTENVRVALNEHPLSVSTIPYKESFGEQLRALKTATKDILEDVVADVLVLDDEDGESDDLDTEGDIDTDTEIDEDGEEELDTETEDEESHED